MITKFELPFQLIELQAATETNKFPFVATVTYGGKLSEHFVGGTENVSGGPYQVLIPADLLREKISELEGKNVYATDDLNSHQNGQRIGEFISAWVEPVDDGKGGMVLAAKASGLLYRNAENKELVDKVIALAREGKLGFSYDLKAVSFELKSSSVTGTDQHIELTDFQWRGATVLLREAAAYQYTQLAANKIERKESDNMDEKAIQRAIQDALTPFMSEVRTSTDQNKRDYTELKGELATLKTTLAASKEEKKPEPQNGKFSVEDLVKGIGDSFKEAIKPLVELSAKKEEGSGHRQSISGPEQEFLDQKQELFARKFGKYGSLKEGDEITAGTFQGMIDNITSDDGLSKDAKCRLIDDLSHRKRDLLKQQWRNGGAR